MSLSEEERRIVVNLEAEKVRKTFAETDVLRAAGLWNNLAGRLYYAAFHAGSHLTFHISHRTGRQSPLTPHSKKASSLSLNRTFLTYFALFLQKSL